MQIGQMNPKREKALKNKFLSHPNEVYQVKFNSYLLILSDSHIFIIIFTYSLYTYIVVYITILTYNPLIYKTTSDSRA